MPKTIYHIEPVPDHSTPRSCTVCLAPATHQRFTFAKTREPNRSSREFVCAERAGEKP